MNAEAQKLKVLFTKLFDSQGIKGKKVEIEEKNLNFAINIKVDSNQSLRDIRIILRTFDQIIMMTKNNYESELELYTPYLTLYLDKYD
ncbi:MAG: hypothetical protein SLAVMIC_00396 [uncultured marine phage]|uniref:Uncharacterized protein n=1 Tax=uncultured marine phage TaxID=707152 RepID=A0A8D9C8U7_9VIRU|nr:MAG: hypothetical protein SLAVMIC_00396 [uncultured marine phage]